MLLCQIAVLTRVLRFYFSPIAAAAGNCKLSRTLD